MITENIALTDYHRNSVFGLMIERTAGRAVFGDIARRVSSNEPPSFWLDITVRIFRSAFARLLGRVRRAQPLPTLLLDYGEFRDEFKAAPDVEVLRCISSCSDRRICRGYSLRPRPRRFMNHSVRSRNRNARLSRSDSKRATRMRITRSSGSLPRSIRNWKPRESSRNFGATGSKQQRRCAILRGFRIWLIAPEGFSAPALAVLKQRNSYGSSRRQAVLLRKYLNVRVPKSDKLATNEYEIVIPMDADAELIAAHAVEEIARRHKLDSRSINQIKTAHRSMHQRIRTQSQPGSKDLSTIQDRGRPRSSDGFEPRPSSGFEFVDGRARRRPTRLGIEAHAKADGRGHDRETSTTARGSS